MSVIDSKDVKFVEDDMMGPGMMDEGDLTYKNNGGGMTSEVMSAADSDDKELEALGYVPSFKREFSNLATISFAFSIMGLCSSISTTFDTPMLLGGPSSVTWCWILGATMCFTLGASIAEIVSAFPTCGGLYTASAQLCPPKRRAVVGWIVGWLNILGQVAGLSSTEFGLAKMIWAAVVIGRDGNFEVTQGMTVGLFAGLLVLHGILNSVATRYLAMFTKSFVFVNLGATFLIIIVLLAKTPRSEMHSAAYVFGSAGITNGTGGWNTGLAFLFGLLSVQWTMTDYDATAHISEEVRRAAYAAPSAIFIAVLGTGLIGWLFNIVLVICSGPLENLPGDSGMSVLQIMTDRIGKPGALFLWAFVCLTAFFVCQTALQACSRTVYAFSRDHGLPDRGILGRQSSFTQTPLTAIWATTLFSILPGLLDFASPVAANAIFSLTAMALDISYIIPIFLRRLYRNHPDVHFKPGPFYMGPGLLGWACNIICILWTIFVSVVFSIPTTLPVTKDTMNYASVITGGVVILSGTWYILGAHRHYKGPTSNLSPEDKARVEQQQQQPQYGEA
ncbi:APC amino acid permease [Pyrrhoderma noxium]|uniref:APC amino acid permease n=1 Tax=Pyrrhoderma noxium TaxID=2282107 RepID=A0A286U8J4_9AGAM|nr:APC amino acid permease [Pyrrhoderma noxium]